MTLENWNKNNGPRNLDPWDACDETDLTLIPDGHFGCVYLDPPWQYGNQSTRNNTDAHYATSGLDLMMSLPIDRITARRSHVWLWTTNAFHHEAYHLLEKWGFEDKGYYVWTKPQMGMGNYFRVSHETLILGVKGTLRFFNDGVPNRREVSYGSFSRGMHSAKPMEVRQMIERCSPGPRLEMFSRDPDVPGWVHWGNEITKTEFKERLDGTR
jgi:N6-adenosine-specific RNA methylase IME4